MTDKVATYGAKLGFILVLIGFMMPISCNQNGFQIINYSFNQDAYLLGLSLLLCFILSIVGIVAGIYAIISRKNIKILMIAQESSAIGSVVFGMIAFLNGLNQFEAQSGAYFIGIGWVIAVIFGGIELSRALKNGDTVI